MKKNLVTIIALLLFQIISFLSFSQDQDRKTYKNNITFNVTRLLLMEARFGYERQLSEKNILRASWGIQFPISSYSFEHIGLIEFFYEAPFHYAVSKGNYLSLGYNYLIIPSSYFYVTAEVYYNYSFYDSKNYIYCVAANCCRYTTIQSQQLKKSGIKFLIGKKISMSRKKKTHFQFDFFTGIGVQYRQEEMTVFKRVDDYCDINFPHNVAIYDPPKKEISNKWYPTLHAGILVCVAF